MADDDTPADGRAPLIHIFQAQIWLAHTRPDDYARWSQAVLIADLGGDDATYERLQRETVGLWREHRDDPLPLERRRTVELAQSIAWLGPRTDGAWVRANVLTLSQDERNHDEDTLIGYWRLLRDEPALPDRVARYVTSLARVREARFEQAATWHREHDPNGHSDWARRRDYADTIGDEWADDATLLHLWVKHRPDTARSARSEPAPRAGRPSREASPVWAAELDEEAGPVRSL